jgi:ribosomal protein S18 acetylase RimI-like enzyme
MRIRRIENSEFNEIANIHIESWQNSYSKVFPQDFLNNNVVPSLKNHWINIEIRDEDVVFVAEEKGIIGFIAVWCRPIPFIDNLHVKPSYRSQKVGTSLMKSAAEELLARGRKTGYLWVFNSNEKAIRFYEKLGGLHKECALKDIFGHKVLSTKVEWDDLSIIIRKN